MDFVNFPKPISVRYPWKKLRDFMNTVIGSVVRNVLHNFIRINITNKLNKNILYNQKYNKKIMDESSLNQEIKYTIK